ncbi:MAG: chromosome partitioning protein ParB [Phyllobacteriaceae bacterium]|nr:chromosome partitioning protein ParB [Phyllobacteriaceae bacterium]
MSERVSVDRLRPTQLTLGMDDVVRRRAKIAAMNDRQLADYLERKAVPHVIGPGGRLWMTDHHHLVRALWEEKRPEAVLGDCLDDWSKLDPKAFWKRMDENALCWPIDADGNRRPYAAIPGHVCELTDNPWRSLARRVRGKAFADLDTPFQEFMWGDYFRSFLSRRLIETDVALAADFAGRLARLDEAQDLPGWLGADDGEKKNDKKKDDGGEKDD